MSEPLASPPPGPVADRGTAAGADTSTAGGLLRRARVAQGLHIAALAAAIKVVPRKLELLESNQFDQLPDATFTRALAQAVCRALKIDPAPVLALLPPQLEQNRLEQVAQGLRTPFQDRPGQFIPKEWARITSPVLAFAALLLLAALVVYFVPAGWLPFPQPAVTRAPSAQAPLPVQGVVVETLPTTSPAPEFEAASAPPAVAEPASPAGAGAALQLHAKAPSWVEVVDGGGRTLLSRLLQPGENVGLDGAVPLRVRIGNASATEVVFRGQPIGVAAFTRENIARFELR